MELNILNDKIAVVMKFCSDKIPPLSQVVHQNPLSVFLTKSSPKTFVSSRILISPNLSKISHRRLVGDLSIFYRYFHGHCSPEIRDIITVPLRCVRTTRSSTHSRRFQVSLPNPRTLSHKSSLIPRTCN